MASRNPLLSLHRRCRVQHLYQYHYPASPTKNLLAANHLLRSFISPHQQRKMGSTAGKKNEYLVIVPDKKGSLQRRIDVRNVHLANIKPEVDSGFLKLGGALLEYHPEEGQTPPMKGSVLIVVSESPEAVREQLSKDIYATSGVWDIDNMQITPFKSAIRLPL
ncbi:hypothetical protein PAAG_07664 [Paracoccidioides lutzii Pb01]|uniref:YCII-related domain-containing protein n=1 Tax=Paracoccidioides lutzii (strain ATCC MYA-826 / Pb01) TaxID=502779 RepID=C1HAL0_PARBA|nr:hypothetical protein PAAG_07664 [Paracoccidioides lutzii Pb01]EEH37383.1 hypothetical protein PAAG_07664 [Paracoccidioides lutzii Pb01]